MCEEGEGRYTKIRKTVEEARKKHKEQQEEQHEKEEDLHRRDLRETVIKKIAKKRLDEESSEVQERAVNKYFIGEVGLEEVHGMVDALHAKDPGNSEIATILHEKFPEKTIGELITLAKAWKDSPRGLKLSNRWFKDSPNSLIYEAIKKVSDTMEGKIGYMTRAIAEDCGGSWWIAKKSRMWADANRRPFFYKKRGVSVGEGEEGRFIRKREFPTSARAALYWVTRKTIEKTVGLDEEGKVKSPFLRLAMHGMGDREHADIVLGGGGKGKLASEKVLYWFAKTLTKKMYEHSVMTTEMIDGEEVNSYPRVGIHRAGKEEAEVFSCDSEGELSSKNVKRDGASVSGAGLGLDYFRTGKRYEIEDIDGNQRRLIFPGFGEEFHTIQAEIGRSLREDPEARHKLGKIMSELMVEFSEKFAELGTSLD